MVETLPAVQSPGTEVAPVGSATAYAPSTCPATAKSATSTPRSASSAERETAGAPTARFRSGTTVPDASRTPERTSSVVEDLDDLAVGEADAARLQAFTVLRARCRAGVGQQRDVVAELTEQQRLVRGQRRGRQHTDRRAARLVAVAVRAVQDVAAPALGEAGDVRQLVDQAGRDEHTSRVDVAPVGEVRPEPRRSGSSRAAPGGDLAVLDATAVRGEGGPAVREELGRRGALATEQVVHGGGGGVARPARIHDQDVAQRAGEGDPRGQASGTAADDQDVSGVGAGGCCGG